MHLFCLPYAGAISEMAFSKFLPQNSSEIEFCPLELPGRGKKCDQKLEKSIDGMIDRLLNDELLPKISDNKQYALWGHSMGGILARELIQRLDSMSSVNLPCSVIVTGTSSPMSHVDQEQIYKLPIDEFEKKIISYGYSNSSMIFSNRELKNYFMPILLADFEALNTYEYKTGSKPNVDLFIMSGNDDVCTSQENLSGWKEESSSKCEFYSMEGGHFFPFEKIGEFTEFIKKVLISNENYSIIK